MEKLYKEKASKTEFDSLRQSLDKHRAESIFNDMKRLFDMTIARFTRKMDAERDRLQGSYEIIMREQKVIVQAFERKFSYLVMGRIEKVEQFMEDIALEQGQMKANAFS